MCILWRNRKIKILLLFISVITGVTSCGPNITNKNESNKKNIQTEPFVMEPMLVYHSGITEQLSSQIIDNLPQDNNSKIFYYIKDDISLLFYSNTLEEPASLWINGKEYPFSYGLNYNPQESEAPLICICDINNDDLSDIMMYGTAYRTELRQDIYLSGENGAYCELGDITWDKNQASHNFSFNASLLDGFQVHITASDWSVEETRKLSQELTDVLIALDLYDENSSMLTDYGHEWKKLNQLQGYSIQYAKKEDGHTYLYYDTQIEAGYSEYCIGYGFRFEYLIQDNQYILNTVSFMDYTDE